MIKHFDRFFFGRENFWSIFFWISKILKFQNFENLTFRNFQNLKKIDQTFSRPNFLIIFFDDFFSIKLFSLPIPIPNFPKIPKIILRKSCDEFWNPGYIPKCYKKTLQVGKIPGNPYRTLWMDSKVYYYLLSWERVDFDNWIEPTDDLSNVPAKRIQPLRW